MELVRDEDLKWAKEKLMPYFGLTKLLISEDPDHKARYPDIWVVPALSTITVTREWARQNQAERRKRLVHEVLHIKGMPHNAKTRRMGYYSHPEKDRYSMQVYREIVRGS